MSFFRKINGNKHNTILFTFVRLESEPRTTLLCYYVPYDIFGLNNVCQSVIFRSIFLIFHKVEVSPKGSSFRDNITHPPSMFSFGLAYMDISKTTHKSKTLRQFIMTCFC